MSELSDRLHADLTTAMKARDELRVSTLRLTLAALRTQEVAGDVARELTDDEVVTVLRREDRKRREAADAFGQAGRTDSAARERAEAEIIAEYLPRQLSDDQLDALVRKVLADAGPAAQRTSITTGLPRFTVLPGRGTVRTTRPDPPYVVP